MMPCQWSGGAKHDRVELRFLKHLAKITVAFRVFAVGPAVRLFETPVATRRVGLADGDGLHIGEGQTAG